MGSDIMNIEYLPILGLVIIIYFIFILILDDEKKK